MYAHERILAGVLARHFFVDVVLATAYLPDLGRHGTYVELLGTHDNLAMAEWMYGFLLAAGERACGHQVGVGAIAGKDRRSFLAGFMRGVSEKLGRESEKHSAAGLVWLGDPDLKEYVARQYPRLSFSRSSENVTEAHQRGRAAGNEVVISRPVSAPVASRQRMLTK